jgi:hypothetical protein
MKLFDLELRGSMYTLGMVVSAEDHLMFRSLIGNLQSKVLKEIAPELKLCDKFKLVGEDARKRDEVEIPEKFQLIVDNNERCEEYSKIKLWALNEEYCVEEAGTDFLVFTNKAMEVFEKAIQLEKGNENKSNGCCCIYAQ